MKHTFITIVGNVGSGKSTLTSLLAKKLPAEKVPADSLYLTNPFFALTLEDRRRWSLTSDLWFLRERVQMVRDIPSMLESTHVVVDSGLPMSYVYAHSRIESGYFTPEEWKLYQHIHDDITEEIRQPDVVIHLTSPVPFLRQRIHERGREFEIKFHTDAYLKSLEQSLMTCVKQLQKKQVKILTVHTDQVDFVNNPSEVDALLQKILK